MNTIRVYHISDQNFGNSVEFIPRVPIYLADECFEDTKTPRICCALTLPQCLYSTERTDDIESENDEIKLYVYEAYITPDKLYQPTERQVFDVYYTGELWLTEPTTFTLVGPYTLRRHQMLDFPYSRFSFTADGEDEVVDRIVSNPVYGDSKAFSFIAVDRARDYDKEIKKKLNQSSIPLF